MTVKRLDTTQKLFVIPQRDEDLAVVADSLLQHRQRSLGDLPLLELSDLSLVELRLGDGGVLTDTSAATRLHESYLMVIAGCTRLFTMGSMH